MRSRSAAFPVRKRTTCCTAPEMADGDAWALIYSFRSKILRQTPRILTRSMCRAALNSKNHDSVLASTRSLDLESSSKRVGSLFTLVRIRERSCAHRWRVRALRPGVFNTGNMQTREGENEDGQFATLTIRTTLEEAQKVLDLISALKWLEIKA
jgi:hypothetical protein